MVATIVLNVRAHYAFIQKFDILALKLYNYSLVPVLPIYGYLQRRNLLSSFSPVLHVRYIMLVIIIPIEFRV